MNYISIKKYKIKDMILNALYYFYILFNIKANIIDRKLQSIDDNFQTLWLVFIS